LIRMSTLKPGAAGWGLSQSLAITGLMTWAVRCLTDLENNFLSVVRGKLCFLCCSYDDFDTMRFLLIFV
jgi:hypothetical protein